MSTSSPSKAEKNAGEQHDNTPSASNSSEAMKSRLKESYDAIAARYNDWTTQHSSLRENYLDKLLGYLLSGSAGSATDIPADGQENNTTQSHRVYRVLELGCGAGVPVTERLVNFDFASCVQTGNRKASFHIVANDLSSTQVELGQKRLGGSLRSLPPPGSSSGLQVGPKEATCTHFTSEKDENSQPKEASSSPVPRRNEVEWIQGDMTQLSFPDESLDAVVGMYSLIHLPREEQAMMIRRIAKWLKRPSSSSDFSSESCSQELDQGLGSGGGEGIMLLNFGDEASDGEVMEQWLGEEKGWMYWSAWGTEKTMEIVREKENGLEVLVDEVVSEEEEGIDVRFLWVIARRV